MEICNTKNLIKSLKIPPLFNWKFLGGLKKLAKGKNKMCINYNFGTAEECPISTKEKFARLMRVYSEQYQKIIDGKKPHYKKKALRYENKIKSLIEWHGYLAEKNGKVNIGY